jgi:hypothetical protein
MTCAKLGSDNSDVIVKLAGGNGRQKVEANMQRKGICQQDVHESKENGRE